MVLRLLRNRIATSESKSDISAPEHDEEFCRVQGFLGSHIFSVGLLIACFSMWYHINLESTEHFQKYQKI